ncbi:hypothetical protein O181_075534 [Austropuccinia psidii MF-1]|uniref:Uncharacterized protein n=1 Tax=Austropuccinia psidii MF-1 TaxID=1389203 RepID=A0A9Q3FB67_9BASI|nr:hypothetical protein [Austropuccinia psidii MF-1]
MTIVDFNHGLWQSPEAPSHLYNGFPLKSRETPNFNSIGFIMREPKMVNIWYYIPLCTISPQQPHGDIFRTKLRHYNCSPQIHNPFQRKNFKPCILKINGGYQQTIQGLPPPGSAGGGLFSLQDQSKGNSKSLIIIQSAFRASITLVFPWTTQLVNTGRIQASYMALALLGQFIFHSGHS